MVLPSTYEGFGMVVIEAMSQKLPVVATPVGCAASLIVAEQTGLLVPPRDSPRARGRADRMLLDNGLRARCAEAAFELVRGLTWAHTAQLTLDVYRARSTSGRMDMRRRMNALAGVSAFCHRLTAAEPWRVEALRYTNECLP